MKNSNQKLTAVSTAFLLLAASRAVHAGEGLFSRTYTTDTTPAGTYELEQTFRSRIQRSSGDYAALDSITEIEYGVTDKFQAALYLNTGYLYARNSPDDDAPTGDTPGGFNQNRGFLQGVSLELIYRVLSPYTDPVGLAFYIEPEYNFTDPHNGLAYDKTMGMEYKAILQKNFFDDRLILAYNLTAETEFIRFQGEDTWAGELDWNNELGASYRFASNWYAGFEGRNHNEYGDFTHHEHSVFWVGPAIHYGGQKFWATAGVLYQVYGFPNGVDENGVGIGHNEFLRSHEQWELTLKIGIPF
jgi:hypothetical protein